MSVSGFEGGRLPPALSDGSIDNSCAAVARDAGHPQIASLLRPVSAPVGDPLRRHRVSVQPPDRVRRRPDRDVRSEGPRRHADGEPADTGRGGRPGGRRAQLPRGPSGKLRTDSSREGEVHPRVRIRHGQGGRWRGRPPLRRGRWRRDGAVADAPATQGCRESSIRGRRRPEGRRGETGWLDE